MTRTPAPCRRCLGRHEIYGWLVMGCDQLVLSWAGCRLPGARVPSVSVCVEGVRDGVLAKSEQHDWVLSCNSQTHMQSFVAPSPFPLPVLVAHGHGRQEFSRLRRQEPKGGGSAQFGISSTASTARRRPVMGPKCGFSFVATQPTTRGTSK
jgi:hypothetical protein